MFEWIGLLHKVISGRPLFSLNYLESVRGGIDNLMFFLMIFYSNFSLLTLVDVKGERDTKGRCFDNVNRVTDVDK